VTEWTDSYAIWRVPPGHGPLPELIDGVRIGDPATLTRAAELIAVAQNGSEQSG
jgi:hypothetical protein